MPTCYSRTIEEVAVKRFARQLATLAVLLFVTDGVALVPGPVHAQEAAATAEASAVGAFSENTLIARYSVDPDVFGDVTSSAELVAQLREHLTVDVAMPLDEELRVTLRGLLVNPDQRGAPYSFLSSDLGFEYESYELMSAELGTAVRGSHGSSSAFDDSDWDEDVAWTWLVEAVETGLIESIAADGRFARDGEGRVSLSVASVHAVATDDWEFEEGLERMYVKLQPAPRFSSSVYADWEAPEGFTYDVQALLIELEPGPMPDLPSVELSAEILDRLVGDYEAQPGIIFNVRREDNSLIAGMVGEGVPEDAEEFQLSPVSETEFWSEMRGRRIPFTFEIGESGKATSVTVEDSGGSLTWPRAQ